MCELTLVDEIEPIVSCCVPGSTNRDDGHTVLVGHVKIRVLHKRHFMKGGQKISTHLSTNKERFPLVNNAPGYILGDRSCKNKFDIHP